MCNTELCIIHRRAVIAYIPMVLLFTLFGAGCMVPDIVSGLQARYWNQHSVQTMGVILGYPMKETSTYVPCTNNSTYLAPDQVGTKEQDSCFEPKYSAYLKIKYRNKANKEQLITDIKVCEYYRDLCSSSNLTAYIDILSVRLPIHSHIFCLYQQDNVTDVRLTYKEVNYFGQYTIAGFIILLPAVILLLFFVGTIIHWRIIRPGYTPLPDDPEYKTNLQLVIEG